MLCPVLGDALAPELGTKTSKFGFKGDVLLISAGLGPPKKPTLRLLRGCKRPPWPGGPKAPAQGDHQAGLACSRGSGVGVDPPLKRTLDQPPPRGRGAGGTGHPDKEMPRPASSQGSGLGGTRGTGPQ